MKLEALHGSRVYLDSNALIYTVEVAAAQQSPTITAFFAAIEKVLLAAFASPLVRAEALVLPLRNREDGLTQIYRDLLATSGGVRSAPVDDDAAELAARLRAEYSSLKLLDALHLAVALGAGCEILLSADRRLQTAAVGRLTVLSIEDLEI